MQININTNYRYATPNNNVIKKDKANLSFEGLRVGRKFSRSELMGIAERYSYMLGFKSDTIFELLRGKSDKRIHFFKEIANLYNSKYYLSPQKEDNNIVLDVFNSVSKPHRQHFYIVDNAKGSFAFLKQVFALAKDQKSLNFVKDYMKHIAPKGDDKHITDILNSPYRKAYVSNFDKFKSYLILHLKDEKAIEKLDNLVKENTYRSEYYDISLMLKTMSAKNRLTRNHVINEHTMLTNYSKEGLKVFKTIFNKYIYQTSGLSIDNYNDIMDIYRTTNKKNLAFRLDVLDCFNNSAGNLYRTKIDSEEISALKEMLILADKDKHVKSLMQKIMNKNIDITQLKEIRDILQLVPAAKADILFSNLQQIINNTKGVKRYVSLLTEMDNPSFAIQYAKEKQNKYGKGYYNVEDTSSFGSYLLNVCRQIRYGLTFPKKQDIPQIPQTMLDAQKKLDAARVKPVHLKSASAKNAKSPERSLALIQEPIILQKVLDNLENPLYRPLQLPKIDEVINPSSKFTVKDIQTKSESVPLANVPALVYKPLILEETLSNINHIKGESTAATPRLNISKSFKELRAARKLKVISDINNIIEKKLGPKTLDSQKADYDKKATKIRLTLLPEIFESIKITRQTDRNAGVKTPKVSNKDAIKLYEAINGNNRKLVRYMLLKTKSKTDDTRLFNIKEILKILENAESEIRELKSADKTYKPRNYYNAIFDKYDEQYGKLSRKRKSAAKK